MFPSGPGFVLVFDYMLSDLAEVIRNTAIPLTEVMNHFFVNLIKFGLHIGTDQKLHDNVT